ncbi:MAG: phosphoribosylamine--glycine ligase [Pseudomonadota bacterium]
MNVLLLGGGGREHALAWKIRTSPRLDRLYCAPGNPGIADCATCVDLKLDDHDGIVTFCKDREISLVVVGPEAPLVAGLADVLIAADVRVFGPSRAAAQLEGSKGFTKDLCREFAIPTADYQRFSDAEAARAYVATCAVPIVVKADGLAAGKGVVIAETHDAAMAAVDACFDGRFGQAGAEVVVEEYLEGEEASVFALCDGEAVLTLATAQDHKRVGDGDTGPNTGGMGAYSPAPIMTPAVLQDTLDRIIRPTVHAMAQRGMPYKGVLYAGLMITHDGPKLIEYNVRFGDPECQVLMLRLKSDLLPALMACCDGTLNAISLDWHDDAALTIVMAANGYPGTPETGSEIRNVDAAADGENTVVFHAGTKRDGPRLIANGGRVLNVTARGTDILSAHQRAYASVDAIDWPGGFYRRDIGWRAISR